MKQLWKRNGSCRKLTLLAFYFYTAVRRWVFLLLSTTVPSCLGPFSNILSYYFEPTQEGIDGFLSQTATWNSQAWNKLHTAQWSTGSKAGSGYLGRSSNASVPANLTLISQTHSSSCCPQTPGKSHRSVFCACYKACCPSNRPFPSLFCLLFL